MKRLFLTLALAAMAALPFLAVAQDAPAPPAIPPIQVGLEPGKLSLNWLSNAEFDLAAVTYDFVAIAPRVDLALAYSKELEGETRDFMGSLVKWRVPEWNRAPGVQLTLSLGAKGLDMTSGDFKLEGKQLVFGIGLVVNWRM